MRIVYQVYKNGVLGACYLVVYCIIQLYYYIILQIRDWGVLKAGSIVPHPSFLEVVPARLSGGFWAGKAGSMDGTQPEAYLLHLFCVPSAVLE